jgi:hypothetical protein
MDPDPDADPDPAIFVSDLQDSNKKLFIFLSFFAFYFLKVHFTFTSFSKKKSHKEVTKNRNQCFSYYFCLMIEWSRSVRVSLTNGSGSGRPKNTWIRIRNTEFSLTLLKLIIAAHGVLYQAQNNGNDKMWKNFTKHVTIPELLVGSSSNKCLYLFMGISHFHHS